MEPLTPADCKNETLASFLPAFFQGAYQPGEAARGAPIVLYQLGGVPVGP